MSRSKYKIGDKVVITKTTLFPKTAYLMGVVSKIYEVDETFMYDIHYGLTDISDEKNVREEDLKFYQ